MFKRLFWVLLLDGASVSASVGPCPISADFVATPEIKHSIQQVEQFKVNTTVKQAFVVGGLVKIECLGKALDDLFPNITDEEFLHRYVQFWAIETDAPVYYEGKPIRHAVIDGAKEIQGTNVKYTYRLFRFEENFAMVATAFPDHEVPFQVSNF